MKVQAPGLCQFCKCTEADPCRLEAGEECGWLDATRTCCTNPKCRMAWQAKGRKRFESAGRDGVAQKKERLSKVQAALRRGKRRKVRAT